MKIIIKVKPKSKVNSLEKLLIGKNTYLARITAPPEKGKANQMLIKLLADKFKAKKNEITIKKGLKSSFKIIEIKKN